MTVPAESSLFPWDRLVSECRKEPEVRPFIDESPQVGWPRVCAEGNRDQAFANAIALKSYERYVPVANAAIRAETEFEALTADPGPAVIRHFMPTRTYLALCLLLSLQLRTWADLSLVLAELTAVAVAPMAGLSLRRGTPPTARTWARRICGIAATCLAVLPFVLGRFSSVPALLITCLIAVVWLLGVDHHSRPLLRTLQMYLLTPAAPGLIRAAQKAREEWEDNARQKAVLPELVQAINRLLQPGREKQLLVQDTSQLRPIHQPGTLVHTRAVQRVEEALRRTDGASVAVSGPRGCGKTTLLKSLCAAEAQFAVFVTAPARYVPHEFLISLFQQVCRDYITFRGASVERRSLWRRRKAMLAYLREAAGPVARLALVVTFAALLFWSFTTELSQLSTVTIKVTGNGFAWIQQTSQSWWTQHETGGQVALVLLIAVLLPRRTWRRLIWQSEPGLVAQARRYHRRLQAEQTATSQVGGGIPFLRGTFGRSVAHRTLPWTMPELVAQFSRFLEDITTAEREAGRTVLICIDEVDRIGTVEDATQFLAETKAIFGTAHCYFVVAVAEEIGSAFARRGMTGRSIVENAFDEVISVEPMSFELSRQLLQRRVPGFTDAFVLLSLTLSGGLPRELIRVARRLVEINIEFDNRLLLPELAHRLVREELHEALTGTRSRIAGLASDTGWGQLLDQLRLLSLPLAPEAKLDELPRTLQELADLHAPTTEPEDSPARKALAELSVFAILCLTICEAFEDDHFDVFGTQMISADSPGPYVELATARRELAISSDSCRAAVERIRDTMSRP